MSPNDRVRRRLCWAGLLGAPLGLVAEYAGLVALAELGWVTASRSF